MNSVTLTHIGGGSLTYTSDEPILLGFDARLGYVSVYVGQEEHSEEWRFVACVASSGDVRLYDVYEEEP